MFLLVSGHRVKKLLESQIRELVLSQSVSMQSFLCNSHGISLLSLEDHTVIINNDSVIMITMIIVIMIITSASLLCLSTISISSFQTSLR